MTESVERKKAWRIFYSPLVLIVLTIALIFMIRALWRVYGHERVSTADLQRTQAELASVQQRAALLKSEVQVLQTPEGVDQEIRSKFNVAKAGEGVVMLVGTSDEATTTPVYVAPKTWWEKALGVFGL